MKQKTQPATDIVLIGSDEGYDWIMVDGVVKDCGHGLTMENVLDALGIPYGTAVVDEEWCEECCGSTPDTLAEFKLAEPGIERHNAGP